MKKFEKCTRSEIDSMAVRAKTDMEARDELCKVFEGLLHNNHFIVPGCTKEDMFQIRAIRFLEILDEYDIDKGAFSSFAYRRLYCYEIDLLRKRRFSEISFEGIIGEEFEEKTDLCKAMGKFIMDTNTPETAFFEKEAYENLYNAIFSESTQVLTEKEKTVCRMLYKKNCIDNISDDKERRKALDDMLNGRTVFETIAKELNISLTGAYRARSNAYNKVQFDLIA